MLSDAAHHPLTPSLSPEYRGEGGAVAEPCRKSGGPKFVDLGLTLEAAVNGQGVALARPSLARRWLERGALVPLFCG
jgi:LysR family transcriptional regulator, glycine cleavage system transcriptional activator